MTPLIVNWGTSLGGLGALIGTAASIFSAIRSGQMPNETEIGILITGIATGLGLLKAKDGSVTGGTVSAVNGTTIATPVSVIDGVDKPYRSRML